MSQEEKAPASDKAPRTSIEDIARTGEELSEEDASTVVGGRIKQYSTCTTTGNDFD